jgi:hypothetical protein
MEFFSHGSMVASGGARCQSRRSLAVEPAAVASDGAERSTAESRAVDG